MYSYMMNFRATALAKRKNSKIATNRIAGFVYEVSASYKCMSSTTEHYRMRGYTYNIMEDGITSV